MSAGGEVKAGMQARSVAEWVEPDLGDTRVLRFFLAICNDVAVVNDLKQFHAKSALMSFASEPQTGE
jgi:hypothetical protein